MDKKWSIVKKQNLQKIEYNKNSNVIKYLYTNCQKNGLYNRGTIASQIEKLEQILNQKGKMFIVIGNYPVMNVNIIEKVSENKLICDQSFETVIDHLINNNKKNILNF